MLLQVNIEEKSIGAKVLYEGLNFTITEGEKVGIVGRNGAGKTTLFKLISGEDTDFEGIIDKKNGIKIVITKQEYKVEDKISAFDYILQHVPGFINLKKIIDTYPDIMGDDMAMIDKYTDAIGKFSELGYYSVEDKIINSLISYKINLDRALMPLINLSGGEKRFVELVKVMYSNSDIALIDEPTNHMDDAGKADFIEWFKDTKHGILVITHDRDVLNCVDRVIEIKDKHALSFPGNYSSYLKQNSMASITNIKSYEDSVKEISYLKKQMENIKKRGAHASTRVMYERVEKKYNKIKNELEKPSIWIDEESIEKISSKVVDKYEKYKDKNISVITKNAKEYKNELLKVTDLSIGYDSPLFANINFQLSHGDRLRLKGRNGAGKTSLIKTILAHIYDTEIPTTIYKGGITVSPKIKLGIYEQEIDNKYLHMELGRAISDIYHEKHVVMPNINKILNDYLFNPQHDGGLLIEQLSGGQKARFQIIKMLLDNPNLLILDEPTNHLDLPSIEEWENSLINFNGAILYVSHDSYFVKKIGGDTIHIGVN